MSDYNITNWYWSVQDTLPGSQVWASASNQYVALADATYVAWLALGNTATVIDTQANLARVFDDFMRTVGRGSLTIVSGSSIQLTGLSYYNEVNSADGKAFMPFVLSPNGWPRTVPYYIKNTNAAVLTVYAFDQTTALGTVVNGETIFLFPTRTNDVTGVGIWSFFHLPNSDTSNAANLTSGLVALARGGTHADLSATGGAHKFLRQNSAGADIDVVQPAFTDISGSVAASQLPNPSSSTLGGIESLAAVTSKWINQISTSGVPSATQPATTDLSDISTGAWTPTDASGAGLTFANVNAKYTKIGNIVFAYARFDFPVTASGANNTIGGLPFTVPNQTYAQQGHVSYTTIALVQYSVPLANSTTFAFATNAGALLTNAQLSGGSFWVVLTYPTT